MPQIKNIGPIMAEIDKYLQGCNSIEEVAESYLAIKDSVEQSFRNALQQKLADRACNNESAAASNWAPPAGFIDKDCLESRDGTSVWVVNSIEKQPEGFRNEWAIVDGHTIAQEARLQINNGGKTHGFSRRMGADC